VKFSFEENSQTTSMELTPGSSVKSYRATIGEQTLEVEILQAKEGKLALLIDG